MRLTEIARVETSTSCFYRLLRYVNGPSYCRVRDVDISALSMIVGTLLETREQARILRSPSTGRAPCFSMLLQVLERAAWAGPILITQHGRSSLPVLGALRINPRNPLRLRETRDSSRNGSRSKKTSIALRPTPKLLLSP